MPSIHDLVASGDWAEVENKLQSREKDEIFSSSNTNEDMGGATPFHLACADEDAPQDIIKAMMKIDGENLNARLKHHDYDATPLHLACETGSAKTVRTLLMWAFDEGCVEDFVDAKDSTNRDALNITWTRHLQPDVESYLGNDLHMSDNPSEFFHKLASINSPEDLTGKIGDTWEKTILLIKARTTGTVDTYSFANGGQWNVVHSAAEAPSCPSIVMWLALKLFAEQAQWKTRDGDLPLHICCIGDCYDITADPGDWDDRTKSIYEQTRECVSCMLLRCYPDAAKVPNKQGRLPLHLVCDKQLMPGTTTASFIQAAPESVNTRDPMSKLFPFMLAASDMMDEGEDFHNEGGKTFHALDATYILLRANPANVEGGICLTEYEKYLKTKLAEEKSRVEQHLAQITDLKQQHEHHLARIAEFESSRPKKRKHGDNF